MRICKQGYSKEEKKTKTYIYIHNWIHTCFWGTKATHFWTVFLNPSWWFAISILVTFVRCTMTAVCPCTSWNEVIDTSSRLYCKAKRRYILVSGAPPGWIYFTIPPGCKQENIFYFSFQQGSFIMHVSMGNVLRHFMHFFLHVIAWDLFSSPGAPETTWCESFLFAVFFTSRCDFSWVSRPSYRYNLYRIRYPYFPMLTRTSEIIFDYTR